MRNPKGKIGIGITTYESEEYFYELYGSLPFDQIDECIVVNGGKPYKGDYPKCDWIQHKENHYPSVCRNDALRYLQGRDVEHFFIVEDDMIIKDEFTFQKYVEHSIESGLEYLCFVSTGDGSGEVGKRTPRLTVECKSGRKMDFYRNMCNEFTYRSKTMLDKCGLYDESFRHMFDVDSVYRMAQTMLTSPFWWFPDIHNSDDYVMNNPNATSRLQAGGKRDEELPHEFQMFQATHGVHVPNILNLKEEHVINHLRLLAQ
jgi:hypothetical protein